MQKLLQASGHRAARYTVCMSSYLLRHEASGYMTWTFWCQNCPTQLHHYLAVSVAALFASSHQQMRICALLIRERAKGFTAALPLGSITQAHAALGWGRWGRCFLFLSAYTSCSLMRPALVCAPMLACLRYACVPVCLPWGARMAAGLRQCAVGHTDDVQLQQVVHVIRVSVVHRGHAALAS
eukprot:356379-Chlamydomonas_euryale.AAC.5